MSTRVQQIAEWMKAQVDSAGVRGIVVGLSGGIDSAVVIGLAARATPGRVVGVIMPCHSDPVDEAHARLTAEHFGVPAIRMDLAPAYDQLTGGLRAAIHDLHGEHLEVVAPGEVDLKARLPMANVKPRLRMTSLYFIANSLNYLVAGTGNRSEITIGYFTKYGDGGVDILPIARLFKSEVRAIARDLEVPAPIIDKPPSAGLWSGQTDEGEMGFTYEQLEDHLTGRKPVPPHVAERIDRLAQVSAHKRTLPPSPE